MVTVRWFQAAAISEGSRDGPALGIVCFLLLSLSLDSFPGFSFLPGDCVACGTVFRPGSVGEEDILVRSRSASSFALISSSTFFLIHHIACDLTHRN